MMMVTRLTLGVWLAVMWVVLWRDVSPANVVSGAVIAVAVLVVFPLHRLGGEHHHIRPVRLLTFLGYFAWQLVVANLVVAREIVTPRDRIRAGIVAVPVSASSDLVIMVVANAISLTPGTLTLEVRRDPPTLYVHVLHLHDLDEVRETIRKMQRMVVQAIGSAEALALLDAAAPSPAEDRS